MKKIKSLEKIRLSDKVIKKVEGTGFFPPSCFYETTGPEGCLFPESNMNYGSGSPLPPSCTCGCSGCIWDDGGTGFSLGMNMNKIG
ncbi:hypothetical protein [uncultured Phocaeicola sp.]|jgi:hypothetical protein|uniref:hypothetical protein n=1 Tax=uncultured Phocaeicola sp. TaxID=990718 RepID=UPI0025863974|nr:hypothetical protein [uncultured Phocaeicola sp.]